MYLKVCNSSGNVSTRMLWKILLVLVSLISFIYIYVTLKLIVSQKVYCSIDTLNCKNYNVYLNKIIKLIVNPLIWSLFCIYIFTSTKLNQRHYKYTQFIIELFLFGMLEFNFFLLLSQNKLYEKNYNVQTWLDVVFSCFLVSDR